MSPGLRAKIRAVLIAIAILANATYAIPMAKMTEEERTDPTFREGDVALWWSWFHTPLTALGFDEAGFGQVMRDYLWGERQVVVALRTPFAPVFSRLHIAQQWGLFAVVAQRPDRLVVEVRRNNTWETLYRRLDGEHDWHDSQLKYRRIRGVWDGVKEEPKGTYKRLTTWLATVIFAEQPDVDRVRVVLERIELTFPWEEPVTTTERRAERYHRREEM